MSRVPSGISPQRGLKPPLVEILPSPEAAAEQPHPLSKGFSSSRGRQDVSAEFREIKSGMAAIVKALVKKEPESKESGGNGNKSHGKRSRSKSTDKASKKPKPSKK